MEQNEKTVDLRAREIPAELYKQFKHLCLDEEVTIASKIIELIKEYVKKNRSRVLK